VSLFTYLEHEVRAVTMFEKMCAAAGAAAGEECPGKELWWFGG